MVFTLVSPSNYVIGASHNVSVGKISRWKVTEYDVKIFLQLKLNSNIEIEVINVTEDAINVKLRSIDYIELEDKYIDYNENKCAPFIRNPSDLELFLDNRDNTIDVEIYKQNVFNCTRDVMFLTFHDILIADLDDNPEGKYADIVYEYDFETGLLLKWSIIQRYTAFDLKTVIELTYTNFFSIEEEKFWNRFLSEAKYWLIPVGIFGISIVSVFVLYRLASIKNVKIVKFSKRESV